MKGSRWGHPSDALLQRSLFGHWILICLPCHPPLPGSMCFGLVNSVSRHYIKARRLTCDQYFRPQQTCLLLRSDSQGSFKKQNLLKGFSKGHGLVGNSLRRHDSGPHGITITEMRSDRTEMHNLMGNSLSSFFQHMDLC